RREEKRLADARGKGPRETEDAFQRRQTLLSQRVADLETMLEKLKDEFNVQGQALPTIERALKARRLFLGESALELLAQAQSADLKETDAAGRETAPGAVLQMELMLDLGQLGKVREVLDLPDMREKLAVLPELSLWAADWLRLRLAAG